MCLVHELSARIRGVEKASGPIKVSTMASSLGAPGAETGCALANFAMFYVVETATPWRAPCRLTLRTPPHIRIPIFARTREISVGFSVGLLMATRQSGLMLDAC
jgi:hypothetical protein